MWEKPAALIVSLFLVIKHVSSAEKGIVNGEEFAILCEFVSFTEGINEALERMKGEMEAEATSLQEKVKGILFGTGVTDINKMTWEAHRELDCGQDSGNERTRGGEALIKDIICLCERNENQQRENLCYGENKKQYQSTGWKDSKSHEKLWKDLETKCKVGHRKRLPADGEFQGKKRQLKTRVKKRTDNKQTYYTYGGHTSSGLQTCRGTPTQSDGICVLYPRGSDGDNASGIKWLGDLEDLVKKVEKMNKDESTGGNTKPSTIGKPSMEQKPKSNTKPSTGENSPAKGSEGPQSNENTNAQTTKSTETNTTTMRPPEEQKSPAKTILLSLWIFFFAICVN
uniref:Variant surface glycoprotein 1125.1459 n=1 Tax=Trypanosoma brucei TaxID=5691 RepID=A0A1J0R710_9TRYP|nr:variant surface glycoprotein 1125.1459 [Trypanosoma brucei]